MRRSALPPRVGYLLLVPREAPDRGSSGRARAALLDALAAHSPTVEPDPPDGAWLDLRAGGRRPPDPADVAQRVLATAREAGFAGARLGVAPTPGVARLAAAHGAANPTLLDAAGVVHFLAPLPIACLGLEEDLIERLALVGLHAL